MKQKVMKTAEEVFKSSFVVFEITQIVSWSSLCKRVLLNWKGYSLEFMFIILLIGWLFGYN